MILECHGQGHIVGYWKEPHLVSLQSSALLSKPHGLSNEGLKSRGATSMGLENRAPNQIVLLVTLKI